MLFRKGMVVVAIAVFITLLLGVRLGPSALAMDCTKAAFDALALKDLKYGQPVIIDGSPTGTRTIAATPTVPQHCYVRGTIWPEIGFAVRLPTTTWNGKFRYSGGGGYDGHNSVVRPVLSP